MGKKTFAELDFGYVMLWLNAPIPTESYKVVLHYLRSNIFSVRHMGDGPPGIGPGGGVESDLLGLFQPELSVKQQPFVVTCDKRMERAGPLSDLQFGRFCPYSILDLCEKYGWDQFIRRIRQSVKVAFVSVVRE